uniref:CASP-like protein n=1 Tax=Trichogramma kaykai TaxID=54128 RepID=A0ABD2WBK8_9HYME
MFSLQIVSVFKSAPKEQPWRSASRGNPSINNSRRCLSVIQGFISAGVIGRFVAATAFFAALLVAFQLIFCKATDDNCQT